MSIVILADIPQYEVTTVELKMGSLEAFRYGAILKVAVSSSKSNGGGVSDVGPVGFVDMGVHRRLYFASLHTGLDGFFVGRKTSTARVAGRVAIWSK